MHLVQDLESFRVPFGTIVSVDIPNNTAPKSSEQFIVFASQPKRVTALRIRPKGVTGAVSLGRTSRKSNYWLVDPQPVALALSDIRAHKGMLPDKVQQSLKAFLGFENTA